MTLYPIKFEPIYIPRLWGRELWLISDMPGTVSVVANGKYKGENLDVLLQKNKNKLIGKGNHTNGEGFPLLVKILEAEHTLSVQVHPNDVLAKARGEARGKDELWYVMEAVEGANLVDGLSTLITREEYETRVENGSFSDVLQHYKVFTGEVYNIPAGRVHSLGAGIKVAEIQQASDTTFRIYDYGRIDSQGNLRELHIKEAADAMNYLDANGDARINYPHLENVAQPLAKSSSFTTSLYEITKPMEFDYSDRDTFVIWMCVEGKCSLKDENGNIEKLFCGEAILIPAALKNLTVMPCNRAKILETYVE